MREKTTIEVSKKTRNKLTQFKLEKGFRNMDEVINFLMGDKK